MINFIIYEDDKEMSDIYKDIIRKFMGIRNFNYNIHEFRKFDKEIFNKITNYIIGKKIYLLDVEVPGMSGVDFARSIREIGDWFSQIIMITTHEKYKDSGFTNRLLMLDFISKVSDIKRELTISLEIALNILNRQRTLAFKHNSEIFQVLYNDIYYIEKNLYDNNSTIVTRNNTYVINHSINKLTKILNDDPRFFKCHRSCIVNIDKITSFDMSNNIIKFKDKEVNLVSRNKKKELKERLMDSYDLF